MIDICMLGTSGMSPLVNRHLSSAIVRCDGAAFLLDCGEGTQLALREAGIQLRNLTNIFKRTVCAYDTLSTVLEYQ